MFQMVYEFLKSLEKFSSFSLSTRDIFIRILYTFKHRFQDFFEVCMLENSKSGKKKEKLFTANKIVLFTLSLDVCTLKNTKTPQKEFLSNNCFAYILQKNTKKHYLKNGRNIFLEKST